MSTIKKIKDSNGIIYDIIDTKNTAGSTDSDSKLYLIGATEQTASSQTYSNDKCYISGNYLYSNDKKVITEVSTSSGTNINTVGTPTVTASNSDGKTILTFNYLKGEKGDTGANGTNGTNGVDGKSVKEVVCVTANNGTTTGTPSTADSGTTYYRVKDTNGNWMTGTIAVKNGSKGSTGSKGDNGTSVTITNINQNTTAGGTSTITFSDGNTLDIKNGSNGTNATTTSVATTSSNGLMSSTDKSKLDNIANGAEVNVQSDWNVTDSSSDAFIKNKPTIPTIPTNNVIYNTHSAGNVVKFDRITGTITDSGYTIEASVPSDAKFTDTVYTHPTTAGNKHIPAGGRDGQYLKYSASGTATWITPANATASASGFMSADDKNKLDRVQDYYEIVVDTSQWRDGGSGSLSSIRCVDSNISEFNFKIGDKIRLTSNTDFPQDSSITQSKYNIGSSIIVTNPNNNFSFLIQPDLTNTYGNAITQNTNMWILSKYGGYIDIIVTIPYIESGEVGCRCVPLYNNELGFNSYYSKESETATNATNATNADKSYISTSSTNSSYPLVFTNNITAGYKSLYTDSVNSCHYNPNSNTLTSPTVSATNVSATNIKTSTIANTTSGNSITFNDTVSLKDYSYIKGMFNFKGSDHDNPGVSISGGSTTTPPTVTIKAKNSNTTNGIVLTGRNDSTAAKIVVYSGTGTMCTITGGSTAISSDERLKNFENDIDIDFDKLKQIPKKYFTWKQDDEKVLNIGTSAQEVEKIYPEIVDENLNEDDGIFYKSVDYSKLSIIALAAIDKLNERIVELEKKIKELEQK